MTSANWLDRVIAWASPARGAARAQARMAIGAMLGYEGARGGRRHDGWLSMSTSADAEIAADQVALRNNARSLVRDNPHAAKGLAVRVSNLIGTGILTHADGPNRRLNKRIDERFERFVDNCDIAGRTDLYGLLSLCERTRSEAGETLIRFVPVKINSPADVPFRLQVLEPDYIDNSRNFAVGNGNLVKNGIEYAGATPVAYYLFDQHPGDNGLINGGRYTSTRVSADDILHYYKPLRPGQLRGVTDFAPVIARLRELDDYDSAERMRKKIAACSVGAVTTPSGLPGASLAPITTDSSGRSVESFAPGMFHYMKPGESVSFHDPKPSDGYGEYNLVQLRAIASGLGMPYELLTGDLSNVNYSSHRGGLVQFRAAIEADQWQLVIPQLCRPIWKRFLMEAISIDPDVAMIPATFTPPRFGLLDPAKEIPPMIEAIKAGIKTYDDTIRREGFDPADTLDSIEKWQKDLKARGIVLTSNAATELEAKMQPAPSAPPAEVEDDIAA